MSGARKRKSLEAEDKDNNIRKEQPRKKRKLNGTNLNPTEEKEICKEENNENDFIEFDIRSWGWMDSNPYKSHIKLTNNSTETRGLKIFDLKQRRGHRIVIIDGITGDIEQSIAFDTWADIYAGIRLQIFMKTLQFKPNKWLIIITHDSGYNINTEAAWNEFEKWGAKPLTHPLHREAYILILSTNKNKNWWQHIKNTKYYFEKKYDKTVCSYDKKKLKKFKKLQKLQKTKINVNTNASESDYITEEQYKSLQTHGKNVFFQMKCKQGKGALILKGHLPKMKAMQIEDKRIYQRPTPVQLAIKNGIKPCDTNTNKFYCVSCLNSSDYNHLLICSDDIHENDDNAMDILPKEKALRSRYESVHASEEINSKFRIRYCGQAFHIYCVTYPDNIWSVWCNFMGVALDIKSETETPPYVELNIKKQHKIWDNERKIHNCNIHRQDIEHGMDENEVDMGHIDFYIDDYAAEYRSIVSTNDLSLYYCHLHNASSDADNDNDTISECENSNTNSNNNIVYFENENNNNNIPLISCLCGNPMVEQICGNAYGETKYDLKKNGGFKGLYCNNYENGCTKLIQPNEIVFRCMNGARCKKTKDGWDYCLQCMVKNVRKLKPKILCLCGKQLILGTINNVRSIFADKVHKKNTVETVEMKPEKIIIPLSFSQNNNPCNNDVIMNTNNIKCDNDITMNDNTNNNMLTSLKSPSISKSPSELSLMNGNNNHNNNNNNGNNNKKYIKKAKTYCCAWCLKKFENKNENVYYCSVQSVRCCRIIKTRFPLFQPFVLCIGCIVQSNWMTQTCICGCNLHCRLLADWIHHDMDAYNNNNLTIIPQRPNGQTNNKNIKSENENENAFDFYMQRRANDDEELYWNELSVKYVHCNLCQVKITAYQFVFICNNNHHHDFNKTYYLCGKCAISNRLPHSLYGSCDANVEVCLLFIAHDGVSQASLWQEWLSENASIRDKFGIAVQCNNFASLSTGIEFATRYRIDVARPTEWGKLLVPLSIQKSMQMSLTKYPKCKRFYIISGREIPLVSMQHLYDMPNVTQLMAKRICGQNNICIGKIIKKRIGKLLQWYSHHAAMCLRRAHAELISVTPWQEYFHDVDCIYDNVGAPDEFLFATTLAAFGINMREEIWREVTTDFELPTKTNVRHPILFNSLHQTVEFWILNGDTMHVKGKEKKSLKELFIERYKKPSSLWGYGPCFFRKISKNVKFKQFKPWKLCQLTPPIVDKKRNIDETRKYRKELDSSAYMEPDEIEQKQIHQQQ